MLGDRIGQSLALLVVPVIGFARRRPTPGGPLSSVALTPVLSAEAMQRITQQMGLQRRLPVDMAATPG